MEASFKSRVEHVFGALLGSSSLGVVSASQLALVTPSSSTAAAANSWSVSDVAIPSNHGSAGVDGDSSGSDNEDQPCAARYEEFVQLTKRVRKRRHAEDDEEGSAEEDELDKGRLAKRRRSGQLEGEQGAHALVEEVLDEDEECREVRLMVGMDDTLDFEEEEDEYDKVAVGREGAGERLYMREIRAAHSSLCPLPPLPISRIQQGQAGRDSRANHAAAAARLEEDDRLAVIKSAEVEEILRLGTNLGSVSSKEPSGNDVNVDVSPFPEVNGSLTSNVKPVLKSSLSAPANGSSEGGSSTSRTSKEGSSRSCTADQGDLGAEHGKDSGKPSRDLENVVEDGFGVIKKVKKLKRVRFTGCDDDPKEEEEEFSAREAKKVVAGPMLMNRFGRVPDHVRNPSKYTHYTLEWSDEEDDHKENLAAFQETWALTRAPENQEVKGTVDLPKSITFTPRSGAVLNKSNGEARSNTGVSVQLAPSLVSFAEEIVTGNSSSADEMLHSTISEKGLVEGKTARVFRKRARVEDKDDAEADGNSP